jgi:peptidoglycan/xylan/chitin deacetylase (PgdA/CDA1 family)
MTIGSHGLLHTRVDRMKDAKQMDKEIRGSRETLRAKLGSEAAFFSYPFGALATAGDSAIHAAGYRAGRAYTGKVWNSTRNIWRLNAVAMTENMAHFRQIVDPQAPREPQVVAHAAAPAKPKVTKASKAHASKRAHATRKRAGAPE